MGDAGAAGVYDFEAALPYITSTLLPQSSDDEEAAGQSGGANRNIARHEIVCRHWLRGICIKDWRCDFLHICDDTRMPFCRSQKRHGRCNEQVLGLCNLRHTTEDAEEDPQLQQSTTTHGGVGGGAHGSETGSLDICMRYLFGYCPHGPMCHLRHVKLDRRPQIPPLLPDWYLYLILSGLTTPLPPVEDDLRRKAVGQWLQFAMDSLPPNLTPAKDDPLLTLLHLRPLQALLPPGAPGAGSAVRCFVLKSGKIENILTSVQKGIWATGKSNMAKLNEAYSSCKHVLLLMSGNESGGFQGYGRMSSGFDPNLYPGVWGTFSNKLSPNFRIQWIKQTKLDFNILTTFTNPFNGNLPLKKSRDGQELTLELSEIICNLLSSFPQHDLLSGTPLQNLPRINHQTFFQMTPAEQVQEEIRLGLRQPPPRPKPAVNTVTPPKRAAPAALPMVEQQTPYHHHHHPPQLLHPAVPQHAQQPYGGQRYPPPDSPHRGRGDARKRTRPNEFARAPTSDVNPYLAMAEELRRRR